MDKTLDKLNIGEQAHVVKFTNDDMSLKLMEMGCLPGERITVERIAPLGDPIAVNISGYLLCLRKAEASTIVVSVQ